MRDYRGSIEPDGCVNAAEAYFLLDVDRDGRLQVIFRKHEVAD
jgi:hypothetical protein